MIPTESKRPDGVAQGAEAPLVHAVVVTWQGAQLLPSCLRALEAQAAEIVPARLRLVVVDNGSTDGTQGMLARDFPAVRLIALSHNLGFSRGCNEGLSRALAESADFALVVNNDVEVEGGFLRALLAAAAAHPRAGLFCGTLLFADGEEVNSTGLVLDRLGRARDRDFGLSRATLARPDGPVEGVSGGAALLRCSTLRQIGLFDPAFFAYYEDVDLSLRAARAGHASFYVGSARARHRFGASFGAGSPRQRYLLGRGHLRTLAKHQPPLRALALVPFAAGYRLLARAPLELARGRPRHALAEARAGLRGLLDALSAAAARAHPQRE